MTAAPSELAPLPLVPGSWTLDTAHSSVNFQIRHLGVTNVRGRFDTFAATLTVGDALETVAVAASIDLASINTNQADRDAHLRSTDFFNLAEHPTMAFASTAVSAEGEQYALRGDLTINGVTKPITLAVEFYGTDTHPADGRVRSGFSATGELSRADYGITFNLPLGAGKLALADKVKIELDLQFIAP
ncbi:YceI family protein [Frankia canadensis]|uniref:YceI family protein n=1 Tax=Frankia canadensis TaxID=1836972 RepID=UPI000C7A7367|nr:YceI family protein [Frankia canadensis]